MGDIATRPSYYAQTKGRSEEGTTQPQLAVSSSSITGPFAQVAGDATAIDFGSLVAAVDPYRHMKNSKQAPSSSKKITFAAVRSTDNGESNSDSDSYDDQTPNTNGKYGAGASGDFPAIPPTRKYVKKSKSSEATIVVIASDPTAGTVTEIPVVTRKYVKKAKPPVSDSEEGLLSTEGTSFHLGATDMPKKRGRKPKNSKTSESGSGQVGTARSSQDDDGNSPSEGGAFLSHPSSTQKLPKSYTGDGSEKKRRNRKKDGDGGSSSSKRAGFAHVPMPTSPLNPNDPESFLKWMEYSTAIQRTRMAMNDRNSPEGSSDESSDASSEHRAPLKKRFSGGDSAEKPKKRPSKKDGDLEDGVKKRGPKKSKSETDDIDVDDEDADSELGDKSLKKRTPKKSKFQEGDAERVPKKRGPKPKGRDLRGDDDLDADKPAPKKRGPKPKGLMSPVDDEGDQPGTGAKRGRKKKVVARDEASDSDDEDRDHMIEFQAQRPPERKRGRPKKLTNVQFSVGTIGGEDSYIPGSGNRPPKLRQKHEHNVAGILYPDMGEEDSGSIMKRRRNTDLKISIGASSNDSRGSDTPYQGYKMNRGDAALPLSLASNFSGNLLESPLSGGPNLLFPLGETPTNRVGLVHFDPLLSKPLASLNTGDPESMRFDFDEVVQHFPSPRPGETLGNSPNRWSAGSAGSGSSTFGMGVFQFPGEGRGSLGSSGTEGSDSALMQDLHARKLKRLKRSSPSPGLGDSGHPEHDPSQNLPSPISGLYSPSIFDLVAAIDDGNVR